MEDKKSPSASNMKLIAQWGALIGGAIFTAVFIVSGAIKMFFDNDRYQIALKHMPAAIGLPCAAIAALCLVIVLENTSGPIEFEGLGFKFKGASGPVILWCLAFLTMAVAIRWLWVIAE